MPEYEDKTVCPDCGSFYVFTQTRMIDPFGRCPNYPGKCTNQEIVSQEELPPSTKDLLWKIGHLMGFCGLLILLIYPLALKLSGF